MNRQYLTSWLLMGVLVGLGFGSYTLQVSSVITADIARWSILLILTAVALLLAMLWQPSELPRWSGRFARLLSVSGWIVLVAGYPLWGDGEVYDLGWTVSVYLVVAVIVFEAYRQMRDRRFARAILAESRLLPAAVACVSAAHLLLHLRSLSLGALLLLLVTTVASVAACFADSPTQENTASA